MGLNIGFSKTLFKIGKWRFGIGYRNHGVWGYFLLACYFMWFLFINSLKLGLLLLILVISIPVNIIRKIKNRKSEKNLENKTDNLEEDNTIQSLTQKEN